MKELDLAQMIRERRMFGVFDDYQWYISPHLWTKLVSDTTPTVAITAGAAGGVIALATDATNNNEVANYTTNQFFKFAAAKPLICESRIQCTESASGVANIAMGFSSAFGANLLVDDGAGPATTMSGALIYKVDGSTVWKFVTSISTTQTISTSTTTATGSSYQTLRIVCKPVTSTLVECVPFCDGVQLKDTNNKPIKHTLTLTGAAAMNYGVYAKAGSGSGETVSVDYDAAYQLR